MKAKRYLENVRKLDTMIQNKIIEAEYWMSIAQGTSARQDCERVQSSGSKQKMADAVIQSISIQDEVRMDIDRLINMKKEVIQTIEQLPWQEYDLLHKMYIGIMSDDGIRYMDFKEVAEINDRTYSWATTIHGRALKHLQDILDERGIEK